VRGVARVIFENLYFYVSLILVSEKKTVLHISVAVLYYFRVGKAVLTCVSHTAHVIAIGWTSVRPFVCLSVARWYCVEIAHLSSNCLHCLVAPWFYSHIAISGCRSLSQSFGDTFFDVAVVGELDFVTWITTILILDLFCHIDQHHYKISSVSTKIHTCLTSCQTTSGARDCCICILYPLHIQEKSWKGSAHRWT